MNKHSNVDASTSGTIVWHIQLQSNHIKTVFLIINMVFQSSYWVIQSFIPSNSFIPNYHKLSLFLFLIYMRFPFLFAVYDGTVSFIFNCPMQAAWNKFCKCKGRHFLSNPSAKSCKTGWWTYPCWVVWSFHDEFLWGSFIPTNSLELRKASNWTGSFEWDLVPLYYIDWI